MMLTNFVFILACALKRPETEDCAISAKDGIAVCVTKENKDVDRTIQQMNNYICHPLEDDAALEDYYHELEKKAARCK